VHVGKAVTVVGITVAAFYCMAGRDRAGAACLMGLEGLVSKRRDSPDRGGRFDRWIKVKNRGHPAFSRLMDQFG
jgi:hypothetical protein